MIRSRRGLADVMDPLQPGDPTLEQVLGVEGRQPATAQRLLGHLTAARALDPATAGTAVEETNHIIMI